MQYSVNFKDSINWNYKRQDNCANRSNKLMFITGL